MKLEDLKHLPVAREEHLGLLNLPRIPVEIAEVEFKNSSFCRLIYVNGIQIPSEKSSPYLVWANRTNKETGTKAHLLATRLEEITSYNTIIKIE